MHFLYTVAVDCGSLSDPGNGTVNAPTTTFMNTAATYNCNTGYNLTGDMTRTCQANVTWSGTAPTCESTFHLLCTLRICLYFLQLSPVQPSLTQRMEWSVYLTTTLGAMLPTPVSLATLSMETPPGLVGVMECGVAVKPNVPVSLTILFLRAHSYTLYSC